MAIALQPGEVRRTLTMKNLRVQLCLLVWLAACSGGDDDSASPQAARAPGEAPAEAESGEHARGSSANPTTPSSASPPAASAGATPSSAAPREPAAGVPASSTPSTPGMAPAMPGSDDASDPSPAASGASKPGNGVQPGTLTSGTWDDNRNYDRFKKYRDQLKQAPGFLPTKDEEHDSAHDEFSEVHGPRQKLDVALVIDTTGSMSDEIHYLQSEFTALSKAIEDKYPNAEQRWALVLYRDEGDEYVTRAFDFVTDVSAFRDKLGQQAAAGGGDFPEAPDAALAETVQLDWRTDLDSARLVFWVADAPHHAQNAEAMVAAIRAARSIDAHVYPVASSGVNELTELSMRSAAQLTGGRYLFLTDDSGVGGAHKEPSLPCYFVTHLDQAILRMVEIELSGQYREPAAADILRRGGDPQDGTCKLESGEAQVF
jgi:hypothetical protein